MLRHKHLVGNSAKLTALDMPGDLHARGARGTDGMGAPWLAASDTLVVDMFSMAVERAIGAAMPLHDDGFCIRRNLIK